MFNGVKVEDLFTAWHVFTICPDVDKLCVLLQTVLFCFVWSQEQTAAIVFKTIMAFCSAGQEVDYYLEFRLVSIFRDTGWVIVLPCCNYDRIECEVMWCTENLRRPKVKSRKGKWWIWHVKTLTCGNHPSRSNYITDCGGHRKRNRKQTPSDVWGTVCSQFIYL